MKLLRNQHGLSAIEFVISMPIVFLLLIGIINLGLALVKYNTINKQAQNAVRYAVTQVYGDSSSTADVTKTECVAIFGNDSCSGNPLIVDWDNSTDTVSVTNSSGFAKVEINYNYNPVVVFGLADLTFNIPLSASAVMRTGL